MPREEADSGSGVASAREANPAVALGEGAAGKLKGEEGKRSKFR